MGVTDSATDAFKLVKSGLSDYVLTKDTAGYGAAMVLKNLRLMSKCFTRNKKPEVRSLSSELDKDALIRDRITTELNGYYFKLGAAGKNYLEELIYMVIKLSGNQSFKIQQLYSEVGKKYNNSGANVDSALRRLLNNAFSKTSSQDLERLYEPLFDAERGAPTNKEFIIYIAEKIRKENLL